MHSSLEREVWGLNPRSIKSDAVLPTARHRCDISSREALLHERNDAEMGSANSLHASALYSEYSQRFNLGHVGLPFTVEASHCSFLNVK